MDFIDKKTQDYFNKKGLKLGFSYKDVWQNEHTMAFTVAKVMELDVLQDIKTEVSKAIAEGKTLSQFKKELKPILSKKGWWGERFSKDPKTGEYKKTDLSNPHRLKTIFNSNIRSARSAGQWARAQSTKDFAPYFIYKLGPSKKHREEHASWNGKIYNIDHPFWDYAYPPNGWGCKCYVTQITKNQAGKMGGVSKNPKLEFDYYQNERTGRKYKVLKGTSPAWSGNAGKFRQKVLSETLEDRLLTVEAQVAKFQINAIIKSKMFTNFFETLGKIPKEIKQIPNKDYNFVLLAYINKKEVSNKPAVLRLTEETLAKQIEKHPDIKQRDYELVQEILDNGEVKKDSNNSWKATLTRNDYNYKIAFKVTENNEYLLNTFHKIKGKQKN